MRNEHGMTMIELLVVLVMTSIVVALTVVASTPWMAEESMRSAISDVQSMMQLTRIEAVSRNHDCRFVIDSLTGELQVFDTAGDVLLHDRRLPSTVAVDRPDSGAPVTLDLVSGSVYRAVFRSDGTVDSGTGAVYLRGGDSFGNVSLFGAGGVEINRWNGTEWKVGF
jgi:prepilin-type N-terminal cleavage/methylation domain-containing protein